jgi:MoaD family protein
MTMVKLYANLRKLAGTKELSLAGSNVEDLLTELAQKNPSVAEMILKNGELAPHIVITLNGHNITDLKTAITEQDTVAIFPPIAGG